MGFLNVYRWSWWWGRLIGYRLLSSCCLVQLRKEGRKCRIGDGISPSDPRAPLSRVRWYKKPPGWTPTVVVYLSPPYSLISCTKGHYLSPHNPYAPWRLSLASYVWASIFPRREKVWLRGYNVMTVNRNSNGGIDNTPQRDSTLKEHIPTYLRVAQKE